MTCVYVDGQGALQVTVPAVPDATNCPYVLQPFGVVDFEGLGITAPDIAFVFAWGVAAVLGVWAFGIALRAALEAIRRA